MEEKYFDYEGYIQRRLKEIDDLDERRYAKELLLEGLKGVFAWAEAKYGNLERRIQEEIDLPWERFAVCTTIVERKNYDPINSFWHPVCEGDLEKKENSWMEAIYLAADERSCREFLEKGCGSGAVEGITESGVRVRFRVKRAARYEEGMRKLHALFSGSGIPWQTVHMGHLERFFDLVPEDGEEAIMGEEVRILWGKWETGVKQGLIPLWNIECIEAEPQEYRYPCLDEVLYEHVYYLKDDGDGYLAETGGDILSVRYGKNEMVVKTRTEEQKIISLYRLHQGNRGDSYGYSHPVLSNGKEEHLAARYLRRTGNFIQTPLELHRRVEELSGDYPIRLAGYEIRAAGDSPKDWDEMEEILEGDMDAYYGSQVFPRDKRSLLLFRFETNNIKDYLYESQIRYILSQLQREFLEYRCLGLAPHHGG